MQFKVPQNIDMEDKIVGPLTLKQFLVCVVGGSVVYLLFKIFGTSGKMGLFLIIGGPIGIMTLLFAFVKVQGKPFGEFFISLITYATRPQKRVWQRDEATTMPVVKEESEKKKEEKKMVKMAPSAKDLSSLGKILDTGGEDKPPEITK